VPLTEPAPGYACLVQPGAKDRSGRRREVRIRKSGDLPGCFGSPLLAPGGRDHAGRRIASSNNGAPATAGCTSPGLDGG
jgi:hypothetical protein